VILIFCTAILYTQPQSIQNIQNITEHSIFKESPPAYTTFYRNLKFKKS